MLSLNALVTFGNIRNLIDNGRWVIHTREVLNALNELGASVCDAEAAQRGYLLTGHESELHRLERSAAEAPATRRDSPELTRDNARQQARLLAMERDLRIRLQELRQSAALRRERGLDPAPRPSPAAGTSGPTATSAPAWPR